MNWLLTIGGILLLARGLIQVVRALIPKRKKEDFTVTETHYLDSGKRVTKHTLRDQ